MQGYCQAHRVLRYPSSAPKNTGPMQPKTGRHHCRAMSDCQNRRIRDPAYLAHSHRFPTQHIRTLPAFWQVGMQCMHRYQLFSRYPSDAPRGFTTIVPNTVKKRYDHYMTLSKNDIIVHNTENRAK